MAAREHSRAPQEVPAAGIAQVVREGRQTLVALPEGCRLQYALYRVRAEGDAFILDPVEEGPRAEAVSERLAFEGGRWMVAGTRMPAAALLEMLAEGALADRVAELCPQIEVADIRACLGLGAELTGRPIAGSVARVHGREG